MTRSTGAVLLATLLTLTTNANLTAQAPAPATAAPIVFFDIAGGNPAALASFYDAVFGWTSTATGDLRVPVQQPLHGVLRMGPSETMIYIGVEDVTATLARVVAHGGRIDQPRFEVPGVVILGIFFDPAGNRLGLVEMAGGRAKVP